MDRVFKFLFCLLLAGAPSVTAAAGSEPEVPALLDAAFAKVRADNERWACTLTTHVKDDKGRPKSVTVVRYDPSLPYDRQWTPLKIDGKEPTEAQIRKYRRDYVTRREKRLTLGEVLLLGRATVAAESDTAVTFDVPLGKNQRFPADKIRVLIRVNKQQQAIENIAVRLREPFRMMLLAKVNSGEADLDFGVVDPQFAPPITAIRAAGLGSIVFVKLGGTYDQTRTDFKRVKPYSERFGVTIGPLKAIDF
jgi:hypothetical protein